MFNIKFPNNFVAFLIQKSKTLDYREFFRKKIKPILDIICCIIVAIILLAITLRAYELKSQKVAEVPVRAYNLTSKEFRCLVEALYFEARGEPKEGIKAVAEVVLNRKISGEYPDNLCKVVYQKNNKGVYQFSFAGDKRVINDHKSWRKVKRIAQEVYESHSLGYSSVGDAMFFYNPSKANPPWAKNLKVVKKVGAHVFLDDKI